MRRKEGGGRGEEEGGGREGCEEEGGRGGRGPDNQKASNHCMERQEDLCLTIVFMY